MNDWRPYVAGLLCGLLLVASALNSAGALAQDTQIIAPGEPVDAELSEPDGTVRYTFEGHIGDQVNATLSSRVFDPLLQVESPEGEVIAENDDSGGSLNSRIESFALPADGTYTIVVSSSGATGSGEYRLNLDLTPLSTFGYGDTAEGEINETEKSVRYRFDGEQGDAISILMMSQDFDSFLTLANSEYDLMSDDDSGGNFNAMIAGYVLPETGTYFITARPLNEFTSGHFTVSLDVIEAIEISYNTTVTDDMIGDPLYYRFSAASGDIIDIEVTSDGDLDLSFNLRGPEGYQVFFDDDSGARLLPEVINLYMDNEGDHILVVNPLGTNQHGTFSLTLTGHEPEAATIGEPMTAEYSVKDVRHVFALEAERLGNYRITATPETGDVSNLVISVVQNGSVINSGSGIPTEESLTFDTEIRPGTFRIAVADFGLNQREISVIIEPVADSD